MSYYIIFNLCMMVAILANVLFLSMQLRSKYNVLTIFFAYYICNFINQVICESLLKNYILKALGFMVYVVLILIFMYSDRFWKKMVLGVEETLINFFSEIISTTVCYLAFGITGTQYMTYGKYKIIGNISATSIMLIFYLIVGIFQKKVNYTLSDKKIRKFMVFIVIQTILPMNAYLNSNGSFYTLSIVFSFLGILADILIIRTMVVMEKKEETEESIRYLEKQNEIVMKYCSKLNNNVSNLESLRNSYEMELQNIYNTTGIKDDVNNKRDILKHSEKILGNPIITQITTNAKLQLENMNCTYDIKMDLPEQICIKPMDLSAILLNMFDNAIEAIKRNKDNECKLIDNKYHLKGTAILDKDFVTITISNIKSMSQDINITDRHYISSKENKNAHGYGMQMIEKMAKDNGGSMKVRYDNWWFENEVRIPVKKAMKN